MTETGAWHVLSPRGRLANCKPFGLDTAVDGGTMAAAPAAIAADLDRLDGRPAPDGLVGSGGAATNICPVKLGRDALAVSERGLRHGRLAERFG